MAYLPSEDDEEIDLFCIMGHDCPHYNEQMRPSLREAWHHRWEMQGLNVYMSQRAEHLAGVQFVLCDVERA